MNTGREPLTPDAVDALLSAQLDGELDDAASELGLTVPEALATLDATPGVEARRLALTRARDLLASRAPLERSVEDRLVGAAMERDDLAIARAKRGRGERQWRVLVAAGSVAAAVALIAVVGVRSMHNNDSAKASPALRAPSEQAAAPGAAKSAAPPELQHTADFGDVSSPAALRAPALQQLARLRRNADAGANPSPGVSGTTAPAPFGNSQGTGETATRASDKTGSTIARDCTAAVRHRYRITSAPVIVGTGSVSGAPVEVLIFDGPGSPVAYVVSAGDCSLVGKLSLGG